MKNEKILKETPQWLISTLIVVAILFIVFSFFNDTIPSGQINSISLFISILMVIVIVFNCIYLFQNGRYLLQNSYITKESNNLKYFESILSYRRKIISNIRYEKRFGQEVITLLSNKMKDIYNGTSENWGFITDNIDIFRQFFLSIKLILNFIEENQLVVDIYGKLLSAELSLDEYQIIEIYTKQTAHNEFEDIAKRILDICNIDYLN